MSRKSVRIIFNDDGADNYVLDGKVIKLDSAKENVLEINQRLIEEGFEVKVIPLKSERSGLRDFIREIEGIDDTLVFNLCEGALGKSSFEMHIAALLELYGVRFTGSGPLTLGMALNKSLTKDILNSQDIVTPEHCVVSEPPSRLKRNLKFPLIVKPLKEDASIGIDSGAVVRTMKELKARVEYIVSKFVQPAIIEEYIEGREFNIAVIGNGRETRPLPPSEIDFKAFPPDLPKICCYEAKWVASSPLYKGTVPVCPANIPDALADEFQAIAVKAYKAMGCRDYARVDMRLGEDGNIKVLEVNPNPDISSDAGLARAAKAVGLDYNRLLLEIMRSAEKRYAS